LNPRAIFLVLGLIALLLVLQSLAARRKLQVLASILLLGLPPLVIALAR
jgi:hypothetical protein